MGGDELALHGQEDSRASNGPWADWFVCVYAYGVHTIYVGFVYHSP